MTMNDFDEVIILMWKEIEKNSMQFFCFVHLKRDIKKENCQPSTNQKY